MRVNQKSVVVMGIVFFLLLVSYRYSLYQDVSQLPYLKNPETMAPFGKLITYLFMIMGIIPTALIMIGTSFFCHTVNPAGTVQTVCFNTVFSLSDANGFIAYVTAILVTLSAGWYIAGALFPGQAKKDHQTSR